MRVGRRTEGGLRNVNPRCIQDLELKVWGNALGAGPKGVEEPKPYIHLFGADGLGQRDGRRTDCGRAASGLMARLLQRHDLWEATATLQRESFLTKELVD